MKLCCLINKGFRCTRCPDMFCVDCWMDWNKQYYRLEEYEDVEWQPGCVHMVKDLVEDASLEFANRWAVIMEQEREKGNNFWEKEKP